MTGNQPLELRPYHDGRYTEYGEQVCFQTFQRYVRQIVKICLTSSDQKSFIHRQKGHGHLTGSYPNRQLNPANMKFSVLVNYWYSTTAGYNSVFPIDTSTAGLRTGGDFPRPKAKHGEPNA